MAMSLYWAAIIEATQAFLETIPWRTFAKRRKQGCQTESLDSTSWLPATPQPLKTQVTAVLKTLNINALPEQTLDKKHSWRMQLRADTIRNQERIWPCGRVNSPGGFGIIRVSAIALNLAGWILLCTTPSCRALVLLKHRFSYPLKRHFKMW